VARLNGPTTSGDILGCNLVKWVGYLQWPTKWGTFWMAILGNRVVVGSSVACSGG